MTSRSSCGFAIFNECDPATCQKQCWTATHHVVINLDRTDTAERARKRRRLAILALAALIPVSILAASVGLTRAERAYQQEQV